MDNAGRVVAQVFNHSHVFFDGREAAVDAEWVEPDRMSAELELRLDGHDPWRREVIHMDERPESSVLTF